MLATARGVSLGIGKINLSQLQRDRGGRERAPKHIEKTKAKIKKHIDSKV